MRKLLVYLRPYRLQCILGPAFKLVEAVFELIVPLVMARIIDVGIPSADRGYVAKMCGVLALLALVGLGCAIFCQYSAARASQGFGTSLRAALFHKINTLSHAELDAVGASSLVTRLTADVNQLQTAVAMLIRLVIRAPFLVIGSCIMAMRIDLGISLIFFAAAALIALTLYLVMSRSVPFYRVIQQKLDRIGLVTAENLEGARAALPWAARLFRLSFPFCPWREARARRANRRSPRPKGRRCPQMAANRIPFQFPAGG